MKNYVWGRGDVDPTFSVMFVEGRLCMRIATTVVALGTVVLAGCSSDSGGGSYEVAPTEVTIVSEEAREGHTFIHYMAKQPAFRDRASDEYVEQRVYVGVPDGVEPDVPVVFQLGQEAPIDEVFAAIAPELIGMPVISIHAEHRGYGQSLSNAEDQTTPSYVSRREAVEDFHEVASALRETYTGPWFAIGISYVGGVVLQYAAKYPDEVAGVSSFSGVVERETANTSYDAFTRELLGEEAYAQTAGHIDNLQPNELFDANWIDREFLEGIVAGLTQNEQYQSLVPQFKEGVASRTTEELIVELRELDQALANGEGAVWASDRSLTSLSREEALREQPDNRYYLWQQCTDIGDFLTSGPDGIWQRDEDDWDAECKGLFGVGLESGFIGHRQDIVAMEEVGVPLVFVSGGKDPWAPVGLEVPPESQLVDEQETWSEYEASYGRHFHAPEAFHCPPCSDREELSPATFRSLFELAGVETPE